MLIINIKYLVNVREESRLLRGSELANLSILENAWLLISNSKIVNYGLMSELKQEDINDEVYDAKQATVLPGWCDSHTHLVFAETRENEFIDKINGLTYAEIAAKGGGILNSARKLNETSEEILLETKVKIKKTTADKGEIVIPFYSVSDLNRLLDIIEKD